VTLVACGSGKAPSVEASASASPTPSPSLVSEPPPSPSPARVSASPSPPKAEATVPVDWTTYTSERYRYAIDYPSDWIGTPAAQDWPSNGFTYPEDYAIDKWVMPQTDSIWVLMFVSSVALQQGETPAERIAKVDTDNASVCQLDSRRNLVVDGVPGRGEEGACFGSDYIKQVTVVNGDRFYLIYILSGNRFSETSLATFDHFLGSFRFL
jgi:hypothetical protein